MKREKTNSIIVISLVSVLHLLLAWGLTKIPLQKEQEMEFLNNLQMVEVNLGIEAPAEPVQEIAPSPEPEPEVVETPPKPELPPPPQEIITTEVKAEKVDLVKAEPKLKPKEKPKPPEKPKEKPKKEPVKPKEKADKNTAKKATQSSPKPTVSTSADVAQPSGKSAGVANSLSTQGNANITSSATNSPTATSASLGAGFGSAMRGSCSNISNESDDEGKVSLRVTVSESGQAAKVEITSSSGINRLDNQAKRMASSHRYSPAKANGRAVSGTVIFSIVFKCGNAA